MTRNYILGNDLTFVGAFTMIAETKYNEEKPCSGKQYRTQLAAYFAGPNSVESCVASYLNCIKLVRLYKKSQKGLARRGYVSNIPDLSIGVPFV
jgi:hypothetical protein